MTEISGKACPRCGEGLKHHWTICPACEIRLAGPACPDCGADTKAHWVLCPECHTRLAQGSNTETLPEPLSSRVTVADKSQEIWTEPLSGMVFIKVPAGSFMMGDGSGEGLENELPVHEVRLDGFYMAKTPVTRRQWEAVTGEEAGSSALGPDHPVTHVDFEDIQAFLNILNRQHSPAHSFDLPSEAQWEFAAKGGEKDRRYAGSDVADDVAWYGENSEGHPHPVALKKPNPFGFFDMSGNVWEWCRDAFSETAYTVHDPVNPVFANDSTSDRSARGGSWMMDAWSVRCARRFSFPERVSGNGLGFRPIMVCARTA